MSKIAITGAATGTATFTIESPATSTNRTLTLPDVAGVMYAQGNIVGTVSQSGGVPTGAIIERGSNANGEFVRFADGTMICTTTTPISTATNTAITLPSTFVNTDYVVNPTHQDESNIILATQSTSRATSSFLMRVQDASNSFVTCATTQYVATGRWF